MRRIGANRPGLEKHNLASFRARTNNADRSGNLTEASAIAKAAIAGQHQHFFAAFSNLVQFLAQLLAHLDKAAGQILLLHRFPILFLQFLGGSFTQGASRARLLQSEWASARTHRGVAMQRHQQGGLQEAQTQYQIEVKRRRHGIALIKTPAESTGPFCATGYRREPRRPAVAGQYAKARFRIGPKQLLRLPPAAGMEKMIPRWTNRGSGRRWSKADPSQTAPPQTDQRTGALAAPRAGKCVVGGNTARQSAAMARNSESKLIAAPAVARRCSFLDEGSGRYAPLFLVREETRLSRSTATPNWAWIRSRIWETHAGASGLS